MENKMTVTEMNNRLREIDFIFAKDFNLLTGRQISELNSERKDLIAAGFSK